MLRLISVLPKRFFGVGKAVPGRTNGKARARASSFVVNSAEGGFKLKDFKEVKAILEPLISEKFMSLLLSRTEKLTVAHLSVISVFLAGIGFTWRALMNLKGDVAALTRDVSSKEDVAGLKKAIEQMAGLKGDVAALKRDVKEDVVGLKNAIERMVNNQFVHGGGGTEDSAGGGNNVVKLGGADTKKVR